MKFKILLISLYCVVSMKCESEEIEDDNSTLSLTPYIPLNSMWSFVGTALAFARPCNGNDLIIASFEGGLAPEDENMYQLSINEELPSLSQISIEFDSEASATIVGNKTARLSSYDLRIYLSFFRESNGITLNVRGPATGTVPYPLSINVNNVEYCKEPNTGFMDEVITGYKDSAHVALTTYDMSCGRRKLTHTELINHGQPTKPGDWPWHTAIYRLEKISAQYVCGGTLISKNFVLTAAHCVTINGAVVLPEIMSVILGKYNLIGGDIASQERAVQDVIVHEEYYHTLLHNDIALLKLKTEAIYNDYVQPACLYKHDSYKHLPPGVVYGTVVGWGLNHTNQLSSQLHQAMLPEISDATCLKSHPSFFGKVLTNGKFCAGYRNGTSACNGDSGGGFMVFVPDISGNTAANATGAYHVHGIVSLALRRSDSAFCDPLQYSIFTKVKHFSQWINDHIRTL